MAVRERILKYSHTRPVNIYFSKYDVEKPMYMTTRLNKIWYLIFKETSELSERCSTMAYPHNQCISTPMPHILCQSKIIKV